MVKGTQGGAFAEHPRRELYAKSGAAKGNPETRWRGTQAGNPDGSRPSDPAGNRAEAARYLETAVFRQQLRISSEEAVFKIFCKRANCDVQMISGA